MNYWQPGPMPWETRAEWTDELKSVDAQHAFITHYRRIFRDIPAKHSNLLDSALMRLEKSRRKLKGAEPRRTTCQSLNYDTRVGLK